MIKWEKAYKGPFSRLKAIELVNDLHRKANEEQNGIIKVAMRKRGGKKGTCVCTGACGAGVGHNSKYDVYIKTDI